MTIENLDEGMLATDGVEVARVGVCVHGKKFYAWEDEYNASYAGVMRVTDIQEDYIGNCCG